MDIFKPFHNPPKTKERFIGEGKYLYNIFYKQHNEIFTATVRGNNQKDARKIFDILYESDKYTYKIQHFQRYPLGN